MTDSPSPEEIILRLEKLIEFFEKHKFVIQNNDEKERPNPSVNRERGLGQDKERS